MLQITLDVPGIAGTYEFDESYFTNGELHKIKQISGLRLGEFEEAFASGDNDLIVAMALVALGRNGKNIPAELLWDAPAGKITIEIVGEAEAVPPSPLPTVGSSSSGNDEPQQPSSETSESTGEGSQAIHLRATGTPH